MMRVARTLAVWVGILVWIATPVLVAAWVIDQARSSVTPPEVAVWVPATDAAGARLEPTLIVPSWVQQPSVLAPAWNGLVQRVLVTPGAQVSTGTPLAVVDGVTHLAADSEVPFSRPLQRGDEGADVAALNLVLAAMGKSASEGDDLGALSAAGIEDLAADIGAGVTEVFNPAWLVYLPGDGTIAAVKLRVATPAPSAGTEILTFTPSLKGARAVPDEAILPPDGVSGVPGIGGMPSDQGTAESATAPLRVDEARAYRDLPPGTGIQLGEVQLGEVDSSGILTAESLAAFGAAVPAGAAQVSAQLVQELPAGATTVPAAAVVTGPTGATCVVTRGVSTVDADVMTVEVIESYLGIATVIGLEPAIEVRVEPPAEDRRSCRST